MIAIVFKTLFYIVSIFIMASSKTKFRSLIDKTPTGKAVNAISSKVKNTYKNLDIKGNINKAVDYFTKK